MTYYHCQCGKITGEDCNDDGKTPASDAVIIEHMPESLRDSHVTAGNRGEYPHNGAIRAVCCRDCADAILDDADDWTFLVEDANPADYVDE